MKQAKKLKKKFDILNYKKGNRPQYFAAFSTHHDHSGELLIPGLSLLLRRDTK
jgi:hypothetical protein